MGTRRRLRPEEAGLARSSTHSSILPIRPSTHSQIYWGGFEGENEADIVCAFMASPGGGEDGQVTVNRQSHRRFLSVGMCVEKEVKELRQ